MRKWSVVAYSANDKPQEENDIYNENDNNSNVWTDNDKATLIKAITRYPGGTSDRWEKISTFVGKPSRQCIEMDKKLRSNYKASSALNKTVGTNIQDSHQISDDIITKRNSDDEDENKINSNRWSQEQQKLLENALKVVDKNLEDRWEKIAEMVPGKTKASSKMS